MYKRRLEIRTIRRELEAGNLLGKSIAKSRVKSYQTVENWQKKPAAFSKFWHLRCEKLLFLSTQKSESKRIDAVEDKQFSRLLDGTASPAEYIFYLCNRRADKWKNNYRVEHSGKVDGTETRIILVNPQRENADNPRRIPAEIHI